MAYPSLKQLTIFLIFIISGCYSYAQSGDTESAEDRAIHFFENGDYDEAYNIFNELLVDFPREPIFNHYAGACLYFRQKNIDKAIQHLQLAALENAHKNSYYYLGRVYHLNYQFDEAIKAYKQYILHARKRDVRKMNVNRLVEMAGNGLELTKFGTVLAAVGKYPETARNLEVVYEQNAGRSLIAKPDIFKTRQDKRDDQRSLMFLPELAGVNEYVYVSGYYKKNKRGLDILRLKNISNQKWGTPQIVDPPVNTYYDEAYPYFDTGSSTLYFSSKGHNSMGGYDIFRSKYDGDTKTWSKPENLDFPVNSPYDDFLYLPCQEDGFAYFSTRRFAGPDTIMVCKVRLPDEPLQVEYVKREDKLEAARLVVKKQKTINNADKGDLEQSAGKKNLAPAKDYARLIGEGLDLQVMADSLNTRAVEIRKSIKSIEDVEKRKMLFTKVSDFENESKMLQFQADEKFSKAAEIKEKMDGGHPGQKPANPNINLKKEINGIKVYEYTAHALNGKDDTTAEEKPENEGAKEDSTHSGTEFKILDTPAYSFNNPVPMDDPLPSGLAYSIQLGVYSRVVDPGIFKGLHPVFAENMEDKPVIKYYTGLFYTLQNADLALEKVKQYGFPDAFIVAWYHQVKISVQRAKEIEYSNIRFQ